MTRKILLTLLFLMAGTGLAWSAEFDHQAHLKEYAADAGCAACHVAGAPSIIPEKSVCVACHQEGEVKDVLLRQTRTHGPVWALNHRPEAKSGAIDCAACHEQSFCLDCHKAGFADEMGARGNNMINVHRSDFQITHPIAARSDQRLCSSCHEPKFCDRCHDSFRLRSGDLGSPSHRRTFDKGFTGVDIDTIHGGFTNSMACDVCHTPGAVAPDFHDWSIGHAREARRALATCQACHPDGSECLKCHSAKGGALGFNPHPDDWDSIKGTLQKASNGRTCRRCH